MHSSHVGLGSNKLPYSKPLSHCRLGNPQLSRDAASARSGDSIHQVIIGGPDDPLCGGPGLPPSDLPTARTALSGPLCFPSTTGARPLRPQLLLAHAKGRCFSVAVVAKEPKVLDPVVGVVSVNVVQRQLEPLGLTSEWVHRRVWNGAKRAAQASSSRPSAIRRLRRSEDFRLIPLTSMSVSTRFVAFSTLNPRFHA